MTGGSVARRAVSLAVVAAVLAAGGLLLHSGAALAEAVQVWRGYYTLVVSSDAPELVRRLEAAGLGPVVAAAGARELVTTFRGYEPVSVADLDVRLDRLDPRFDPYLQAVGKWFAAGPGGREARIVYVAQCTASRFLRGARGARCRRVRRALGDRRAAVAQRGARAAVVRGGGRGAARAAGRRRAAPVACGARPCRGCSWSPRAACRRRSWPYRRSLPRCGWPAARRCAARPQRRGSPAPVARRSPRAAY